MFSEPDRIKRRGRSVRGVWAACLLLAGLNHARNLVQHGLFWDYYGAHPGSAVYWSSLTLIDPLIAALLFVRPRIGVPATVVLIASNVVHNLVVTARYAPSGAFLQYVLLSWQLLSQIGFFFFVLATWQMAFGDIREADTVKRST